MPKLTDKERVSRWNRRTAASTKEYEEWEKEWDCKLLERYYYGQQWASEEQEEISRRKYVINLFYPSINIAKPSLLFQLPKYKVTPRPTRLNDPLSDVEARAKLQEETLNSFVQDPDLGFSMETGLAILDAQFRFGVVQVGYTADFIDNPNAGKPILRDDVEMLDKDGEAVPEPNASIENERLYLKWIDAKQWRIAENSRNRTAACDWVGYSEWHYADDVKANPRYKNTTSLKATGRLKTDKTSDKDSHPGMVKVWFIWDIRSKARFVFADGGEKFFLEESYSFLPFACLKFDEILGQWLPLPPTYNWAHPQNELNDVRETDRIHRARAKRRFGRRPSVTAEEFAKLQEGDDMVCIELQNPETDIVPIPDAPLDQSFTRAAPNSIEDFIRVSGISGESQQIADSGTATQANLIALAGRVREAARRMVVAQWLGEIGRIMLMTLAENMTLPFWIKKHVDPTSPSAEQEAQELKILWEEIVASSLGNIDNDVAVDIESMSPVPQEQGREQWLSFLNLVVNPQLGAILSMSPTLLRKTAGYFDIHSERDIAEVSKAMQMAAVMFAQAQAQAAAGKPGATGPGPTPTNAEIGGQLNQQLPVEMAQGIQ